MGLLPGRRNGVPSVPQCAGKLDAQWAGHDLKAELAASAIQDSRFKT
jgi:hypothetical protein